MADLASLCADFRNKKVLCIGDVILDSFVYGDVSRISPEAPVPVFNFRKENKMLGGACNVVANLAALGGQAAFIGMVGNDDGGKMVAEMLSGFGAEAFLPYDEGYPTTIKTRFIAGHQHILRCDKEEIRPLPEGLLPELEEHAVKMIDWADIIILSDYNKGFLSKDICQLFISLGKKMGKVVLTDPKGGDYSKYKHTDLVKPNLKEFCQVAKVSLNPTAPDFVSRLTEEAIRFLRKEEIGTALITLSEYGMFYIEADRPETAFIIKTEAKEVFDVSGAGDTSIATFALAKAVGASALQAAKLANIAAGIVVGKLGTAVASEQEMQKAITEILKKEEAQEDVILASSKEDHACKIVSLQEGADIACKLREQGKVIGFTNGCFDLLHRGHLYSIAKAKENCDVLFVGLNSDKSVKRLKGEERPIQDERTRAELLAGLVDTDFVIIFDEDDACLLIDELKPDVIAKQGYDIKDWPEAQKVKDMGGKVVVIDAIEGVSTTDLIKRMGETK